MLSMLKVYGRSAATAFKQALRSWPVALSLVVYLVILLTAAKLVAPLGILGGFLLGLVLAACISSYLHLLARAVDGAPIRLEDFKQSFGARFWDAISILFAFWIINFVVAMVTRGMGPNGTIMRALIGLAMAVFFNAVPELMVRGRSRSFGLLGDSGRFISAHWPEWLAPNLILAAVLLIPAGLLSGGPLAAKLLQLQSVFSLTGLANTVMSARLELAPVMLFFVHWAMIFRGLLFLAIVSGGARRQALGDAWRR